MPARVLILAPWARPQGGAERMLQTFVAEADSTRVELELVFFEPGRLVEETRAAGIMASVIAPGRLRDPIAFLRTVGRLRHMMRTSRPDVVLSWMAKCHLYAAPAVLGTWPRPALVWWQHMLPHRHWMDLLATALPAAGVGASSRAAGAAQGAMRPRREVEVIQPGTTGVPVADDAARAAARRELGIADGAVVVTIVGRLQPWKRQDRVLRALALLRGEGLNVHGLVVGGDSYELAPGFGPELVALADRLGLRERVTFTGHRDDVAPVLMATDVLVNASEGEPFGIVVIEALSAGVPVVAVDAAGPREILSHGGGRLVASSEPGDLAGGLRELVTDSALRARLGQAGRASFIERYRAPSMARRIETLLLGACR